MIPDPIPPFVEWTHAIVAWQHVGLYQQTLES